jgi:hypothetical protein
MSTSLSDIESYRSACTQAARDDATFARFRRVGAYTEIVEPDLPDTDASPPIADPAQVRAIVDRHGYAPLLDRFRLNDTLGDPVVTDYPGLGRFNRFTLRYMKVLGDLEQLFGSLDGLRILEVGAGYGGQCAIIARRFAFARYTLVDLPEALELSGRYLRTLGIDNVVFQPDFPPEGERYDLLISTYALSELGETLRAAYYDRVLPRTQRGYVLSNKVQIDHTILGRPIEETMADLQREVRRIGMQVRNFRIANDLLHRFDQTRLSVLMVWGAQP